MRPILGIDAFGRANHTTTDYLSFLSHRWKSRPHGVAPSMNLQIKGLVSVTGYNDSAKGLRHHVDGAKRVLTCTRSANDKDTYSRKQQVLKRPPDKRPLGVHSAFTVRSKAVERLPFPSMEMDIRRRNICAVHMQPGSPRCDRFHQIFLSMQKLALCKEHLMSYR